MKNLEKKIIKNVYDFETRYTIVQIVFRLLLVSLLIIVLALLTDLIVNSIVQQESFAMFEIFNEDFEVIWENLGNVVFTFMEEAPLLEILTVIFISFLFMVMLIRILLKLRRIRNKFAFLLKYWVNKLYEKWKN